MGKFRKRLLCWEKQAINELHLLYELLTERLTEEAMNINRRNETAIWKAPKAIMILKNSSIDEKIIMNKKSIKLIPNVSQKTNKNFDQ